MSAPECTRCRKRTARAPGELCHLCGDFRASLFEEVRCINDLVPWSEAHQQMRQRAVRAAARQAMLELHIGVYAGSPADLVSGVLRAMDVLRAAEEEVLKKALA